MYGIHIDEVDHLERPVLAIGTEYPPDYLLERHRHRRAQFLYGATGTMRVDTEQGSWTVPNRRAVLIPPNTEHEVLMRGVSTRSLYFEPAAAPWFPDRCLVVEVSALLRELVLAAVDMPAEYPRKGRHASLVELIMHELRTLSPLPFELPLPVHPELRQLCLRFQSAPNTRTAPAEWAAELHLSERTLNRLFRTETGLSYRRWRQRACAVHAIHLLSAGTPVTSVAGTLGYANPAAFSTMFRAETGVPPNRFMPHEA